MLERDILTKTCPQRWQDLSVRELRGLDVVLCFDDRIFEIVLEDLQLRVGDGEWRPLHLLCLDTKDTPEHAKIGGSLALELCQAVRADEPTCDWGMERSIFTKTVCGLFCSDRYCTGPRRWRYQRNRPV